MKKLIHDIHNGKNVRENLKRYADLAIRTYVDYAILETTFSSYTLLEEAEEEKAYEAEEQEILNKVLASMGMLAGEDCDYTMLREEMSRLREEITGKMDLFTAYTDRMICYEYVLNRMEFRFLPAKELAKKLAAFEEKEYMKELNRYLFGNRDEKLILDKLRLVIGQIPVHLTKSKLFEKIGEALTLYQGGDRSSLDSFLYMLRTSAMLYEPQQYVGQYPAIEKKLLCLSQADYETMPQEQFEELSGMLETAAKEIHEITDFYYSVQKVVNGIYALCVILPYADGESRIGKLGRPVWKALSGREYKEELLQPLEGNIEECVEKSSYLESILYEIRSSYGTELMDEGLTALFEDFTLVANLMSDSLFIDLSSGKEEEKADMSYIQSCREALFDELSEKFRQVSRPVKRAIMGQILEKLPMTFQNAEEVQQYIQVNLMGCQDKAEKCVVLTMLWDLMQEEDLEMRSL